MTGAVAARGGWRVVTRGRVVTGLLVLAVLVFGCVRATWLAATVPADIVGRSAPVTVSLTGAAAAGPVSACAIVLIACAAALTIARRRGRQLVLVLAGSAAVGIIAAAARVLTAPQAVARPRLADAAGLTTASVPLQAITTSGTPWPAVTVGIGAAAVLLAVLAVPGSRHWDDPSRFSGSTGPTPLVAAPAGDDLDAADSWDALTRGLDPTRGRDRSGGRALPEP